MYGRAAVGCFVFQDGGVEEESPWRQSADEHNTHAAQQTIRRNAYLYQFSLVSKHQFQCLALVLVWC